MSLEGADLVDRGTSISMSIVKAVSMAVEEATKVTNKSWRF